MIHKYRKVLPIFIILFFSNMHLLYSLQVYTIKVGSVSEGEIIKKVISLTNKFNKKLRIEEIIGDCTCISGIVLKDKGVKVFKKGRKAEIMPGNIFRVLINFNTKGYTGEVKKRVYIKGKVKDEKKIFVVDLKAKILKRTNKKKKYSLNTVSISLSKKEKELILKSKSGKYTLHRGKNKNIKRNEKYFLTIITDQNLNINLTDDLIKHWELMFNNNLYVRKIDFRTYYRNKNTIKIKYNDGIVLPIFIFHQGIENNPAFNKWIKNGYVKKMNNNDFILSDEYYSEKIIIEESNKKYKERNKRLDLFIMSHCPFSAEAVTKLIDNLDIITNKVKFSIYYIAEPKNNKNKFTIDDINSLHGREEVIEDIRQLLIKKIYPDKYYNYLYYRNKDPKSRKWLSWVYDYLKMDKKKIENKIKDKGVKLLIENIKYARKYNIKVSPTFMYVNENYILFVNSLEKLKKLKPFKNLNIEEDIGGLCQ